MTYVLAVSSQEFLFGLVASLATVFTMAFALARWPGERRKAIRDDATVIITQQQGAATLINDVAHTLQAEIERKDRTIIQQADQIASLETIVRDLRSRLREAQGA
jgi:hypothetical protein